jgi:hypothetical protein
MGDSNGDGVGSGVDGDSSGGNSPSRQGVGTETSVSRTSSSMAAELQNFSWMVADSFRVFALEGFYRRKGDVRGWPGGPHHTLAWPEGGREPPGGAAASWPSSVSDLDSVSYREKYELRASFCPISRIFPL